jgi:hypothetical protein
MRYACQIARLLRCGDDDEPSSPVRHSSPHRFSVLSSSGRKVRRVPEFRGTSKRLILSKMRFTGADGVLWRCMSVYPLHKRSSGYGHNSPHGQPSCIFRNVDHSLDIKCPTHASFRQPDQRPLTQTIGGEERSLVAASTTGLRRDYEAPADYTASVMRSGYAAYMRPPQPMLSLPGSILHAPSVVTSRAHNMSSAT